MSYAIIKLAGKQYQVSPGDELTVDRLEADEGDTIKADVLLLNQDDKVKVGQPTLDKTSATLKVLSHQRSKKLDVMTYKSKSRYRRRLGHRSATTTVKVDKIAA